MLQNMSRKRHVRSAVTFHILDAQFVFILLVSLPQRCPLCAAQPLPKRTGWNVVLRVLYPSLHHNMGRISFAFRREIIGLQFETLTRQGVRCIGDT
jgi:hypothetical protein